MLVLPAAILAVGVVQLLARAFPFEAAPLVQLGVGVAALLIWEALAVRRRPGLVEAARLADESWTSASDWAPRSSSRVTTR